MTEGEVIYSVKMRRGPDARHYDLYFMQDRLELRYLGEYWDTARPVTGIQRRADLLIYSIRKRRRRSMAERRREDIVIPYSEVKRARIVKPRSEDENPVLVIETRRGDVLELEFTARLYRLVQRLVNQYLSRRR